MFLSQTWKAIAVKLGGGAFQKMLSFFLSYAMGEEFSHRIHRLAEVVLDAQNGGRSETSNL